MMKKISKNNNNKIKMIKLNNSQLKIKYIF